jgi:nickel transport protein
MISLPLQAHKLKVFATAEGEKILGRAYFVGGAGANGALVTIQDAVGHELARLEPDEAGNFSYRVERRMSYRVLADSRDGHVASWILREEEFSPGLPGSTGVRGAPVAVAPTQEDVAPVEGDLRPAMTVQIERAVAHQIRPLRLDLQAHEERVRLRDIVGGIGYIVGLAGLGLWWSGRRRARER